MGSRIISLLISRGIPLSGEAFVPRARTVGLASSLRAPAEPSQSEVYGAANLAVGLSLRLFRVILSLRKDRQLTNSPI